MSGLNDSVIICDAFPKSSRKRAPLGSKKSQKPAKKTFYESPLRHIQLSSKRWQQMQAQKKLMRQAQRAVNKELSLTKEEPFQDSVIILSDNECESNRGEDENNCLNNPKSRKRPLQPENEGEPVIQFSLRNSDKTLKQKDMELKAQPRKKRKMESTASLDLSCLLISDTEDSEVTTVEIDDENIAPSNSVGQGSDDIVVVWSSTKECSPSKNRSTENTTDLSEDRKLRDERKKHASQEEETTNVSCEEEESRVFMIDCNPNVQNLTCLSEQLQTEQCEKDTRKNDETDGLLLNKPGLVFPTPHNISKKIVMAKPKSSVFAFKQQLEQQAFNLSGTTVPSVNMFNLQSTGEPSRRLREIIIDGNNVAMAHKNHKIFSEEGLLIVIDYFRKRGHVVKVFIPQCRRSTTRPLLEKWYNEGIVIFTPSRYIGGRWITSYDDRFILQYATMCGGVVISSDQYRDLYSEKPEWRDTIENRLLPPTFVGDIVMFPEDPLGRRGPKLDEFLRYTEGTGSTRSKKM